MTSYIEDLPELYESNPELFEEVAQQLITEFIASIPDSANRRRCEGLQFKINAELTHCHDPVARMNKMVELFWSGVFEFNSALKGEYEEPSENAQIIPFTKK